MCCVEDVPHACLVKFKLSCTVPYCHLTYVIWQKVPVQCWLQMPHPRDHLVLLGE